MSYSKFARLTVCSAALALSAHAAFAEVDANDVWDTWQDDLKMYGEGISVGEVTQSGDTLTISTLSIDLTDENNLSTLKGEIGPLILTSQDDGTVNVDMPSILELSLEGEDFGDNSLKFIVSLTGQTMTASGTPGEITYDYAADKYGISIVQDRASEEDQNITLEFVLNGVTGTHLRQGSQTMGMSTASTTNATLMSYIFGFEDLGERFDISGQINGLSAVTSTELPANYDAMSSDIDQLKQVRTAFELTTTKSTTVVDYETALEGAGNTVLSTNGGTTRFELIDGAFAYDDLSNDVSIEATAPGMPFTVAASAEQLGFGLAMPFVQSETPKTIALSTDIIGLDLDPNIWGFIDPTDALPHDPLTLAFNLEGTGRLVVDLDDEEAMNDTFESGKSPFELQTLSLTSFLFSALGAELKGAGDFTFDNSDLVTFDGFPAPEGRIELLAIGVNGLLDKLSALPLGMDEQIMGARMMLGMFTTVTGDDELTSSIEIEKTGAISVNGQRMR